MLTKNRDGHAILVGVLASVAVITAFLIGISVWLTKILSAPDWCSRAIGAAKYADGPPEAAIGGCFNLLNAQLAALAFNSHIAVASPALSLLVLMVVVLAGGKLSFSASKEGVSANVGRELSPTEAAQTVQNAVDEAADVAVHQVEKMTAPPAPDFAHLPPDEDPDDMDLGVRTP